MYWKMIKNTLQQRDDINMKFSGIVVGRKLTNHTVPPNVFPALYSVSWAMQVREKHELLET